MPGVAYPGEKILKTASDREASGEAQLNKRVLVTGSAGQIGNELVPALRALYGDHNVIASDVKHASKDVMDAGPFVYCDVTNPEGLNRTVLEENVDYVVHLASLLSVIGERNPQLAIQVNVQGIQNILECARLNNLRVLAPSTIAVFGENTPGVGEEGVMTPDLCTMRPSTIYGVTKVYLELLGEYYKQKYVCSVMCARSVECCAMGCGGRLTLLFVELLKIRSRLQILAISRSGFQPASCVTVGGSSSHVMGAWQFGCCRNYFEQDSARRRYYRLRSRHFLQRHPRRKLQLLPARGQCAAHDVHARCRQSCCGPPHRSPR